MVSLHCRLLDRAVYSFDLAIGPRVIWLGEVVLNSICFADHVEPHLPRICSVPVAGLFGELDTIVSEDPMNEIRDSFEQMFEEFQRCLAIRLFHESGDCKLAGPVYANKELWLSLRRLDPSYIDMEIANGIVFELLPLRLVALDIR